MAPKTAKGQVRQYEPCCVAWVDLLGYGSQLQQVNYDPTLPESSLALRRLHDFHEVIKKHACRFLPSLVLNDGVILYRDLSPRSRSVTWDFLRRAIALHTDINQQEDKHGQIGARMVIGAGFRVRRPDAPRPANQEIGQIIKNKLFSKKISPIQAVEEALRARPYFDVVPEIQANFALSKAYLAESSGRKAGFAGANCFIDMSLLTDPPPKWLTFSHIIDWQDRGMMGKFGCLQEYNHDAASAVSGAGTLDAWDVAERLSSSTDVLNRLRSARITNNLRISTPTF